ncbi:nitrate reductase [Punctularia strigosozonata HHB-11173 SS5]|uniref:nitrate reductase n=1 Tax=Punctularia strigosozonata (strain HHB-11173) TaxID=741275 RepID=UPI0004417D63|nr:nitrate reductase [Punctularia strigosozonata HHB-11173 SS5]EIN13058.1 nitrate reductase [Punctularia strigosozonata HHB-11173 SS5]
MPDSESLSQSSSDSSFGDGSTTSRSTHFSSVTSALPDSKHNSDAAYPRSFPTLPIDETPDESAEQDLQTPDRWVHRNPDLVRLTGKHPFNCEARLPKLIEAGFLTPAHLHFVRNHGAVPRIEREQFGAWTLSIGGLVKNPLTITLQELKERFPVVTIPVTLVCAGNRRKEQNVIRQSLGFSWGAAGVSTALWTGVYLADVLAHVQPVRPKARHVVFEGADNLPQGPYGTSQLLSWATSKERGMLIAWGMNGQPLEPDHGFPVRLIVPGQIGGRSVKWLRKIEVSDNESQHHVRSQDNKVLPRQLSPDNARAERDWWYDRKYLITELNINSVIAKPDHDERLHVSPQHVNNTEPASYPIRGYAYSGGGRRITRVEVTLDDGKTWKLATIDYPEDLYRELAYEDVVFGSLDLTERDTSFCWCFWSLDVPLSELAKVSVIQVCAMDESMNMQPRDMYLNATSMLNNCMFRVAVIKSISDDGDVELHFEHPTLAGSASGGWMERIKAAGGDLLNPQFGMASVQVTDVPDSGTTADALPCMTKPGVNRQISMAELAAQDKERPWFVVNGEVYDGTTFLKEHPGGGDSILLVASEDASEDFIAIHSVEGKAKLAEFHIGTLVKSGETKVVRTTDDPNGPFLNPKVWKATKLASVEWVNHDSCLFRFLMPDPQQDLGLPIGQHVFLRLKDRQTGETIQRAYTPVSKQTAKGSIELLVKLYLPSPTVVFGGKMSTVLNKMQIGDEVELKGPLGSFTWNGTGEATWKGQRRTVRQVGMICGGSGITPILQVLRGIFEDETDDRTQVWLICSNKTEHDILCWQELEDLHNRHGSSRFRMRHTLNAPPSGWAQSVGRIDEHMMREYLPPPSNDTLILACGPNSMITQTIKPGLTRLGWDIERSLVVF